MTVAPIYREEPTLDSVAAECLENARGDNKVAAELLEGAVRKSQNLRDDLTEPLIHGACWDLIRRLVRQSRQPYWSSAAPPPIDPTEQGKAQRAVAARSLYDYPLTPSVRLGDAVKSDLLDTAEMHQGMARANAIRARWFLSIAGELPEDGIACREVLSEDRLAALQREAEHA